MVWLEDIPICEIPDAADALTKKQTDGLARCQLLTPYAGLISGATVERITMRPAFNAPTIASEADSAAVCLGVLSTLGQFVINQQTPSAWKSSLGVTTDKATAVGLARKLVADLPKRLKHDKAEAVLLAIYSDNANKKHYL